MSDEKKTAGSKNAASGLTRRGVTRGIAAGLAAALAAPRLALADDYPTKPIRMIIPFSPGGPVDIFGRITAQKLSDILKQPVVTENRPGANGTLATSQLAKATPDGYTMMFQSGSHTANASIYAKLPYDPLKDFIGVTQLSGGSGQVLVVHPDFPAKTLEELVEYGKKNPKKLTFGHGGVGNATHVAGELLAAVAGFQMTAVPYTGGGGPITALLGREIDISFSSSTAIASYVNTGRMRALVISTEERNSGLPGVPSVVEAGYKDAVFTGFFGIWFPKGVAPERVDRIYRAGVEALKTPEIQKYLADGGAKAVGSSPAEYAKFLEADLALQASIAKRINLKPVQ